MASSELGPIQGTVQTTTPHESLKSTLLEAVTIELRKSQPSDSTVSITLGNRRGEKTFEKGSNTINWEPEEAWEITTGNVLKVSFKTGGVLNFPWGHPNEVEIDSDEILSESITHYNQSVTKRRPDGTTVFEHVFEDKGHKITMKFSILDEPRLQSTLSPRPQRGSQPETYPEAQSELEDALQPKLQPETRPDPFYEEIKHAAKEAVKIESIYNRLGASITYLEGLLSIGDVVKDIYPSICLSIELLSGAMKIMEMEDEFNQNITDLAISMSDIVIYVFDVEQFATIAQLMVVIEEANDLIRRTVNFFNKHKGRGIFMRMRSAFSGEVQEELENLQADFNSFRGMFDCGISVQTMATASNFLSRLEVLGKQFTELVRANEDDKVLEGLNTRHQTRALRCLDGTRKDLIASVIDFAVSALNILWIFGYPGCGKSTLAMHAANLFRISHRLGIIVEFSRNTGIDAVVLWKTIAYALAYEYPECRKAIVAKLKSRSLNMVNATSREIFNQLVAEPLRQLTAPGSNVPQDRLPVVIIDALDECGGLEGSSWKARKDILECLADWAKLASGVKLIVTSRAEQDIMQVFNNIPHTPLEISTGTSATETSTRDIELYLKHEFMQIATRNGISGDWPGDKTIADLASRAQGVFIWATTILSFVDNLDPELQLKVILGGQFPSGDVYGLYRQILETSFPPTYDAKNFVLIVGATVVLQRPFTPIELSQLLGVVLGAINGIRKALRTVLDDRDTLRFRHQSFVNFLTGSTETTNSPPNDQYACPERFRINASESHGRLCECLFNLMHKELHFNICNIPSSFMRNEDMPQGHFDYAISRPLAYACTTWGFHLESTGLELNVGSVETFIRVDFLPWIESLSGLRSLIDAVPSLITLEQWLLSHHKQSSDLKMLVKDGIAFIRYFVDAISLSAPHVYISALAFAPKSSMIARLYAHRFKNIIRVVVGRPDEWPAGQAVVRSHSGTVNFVVFSPDGRRVVSCSYDKTVRISDTDSTEIVAGPFKGHNGDVLCAVYSADGKTVLSVSRDKTVRRWDAECGVVDGPVKHDIVTIGGIDECLYVTFSHNRKYIASVQRKDTTSRSWTDVYVISVHDVVTGQVVTGPIEAHEEQINCVTFSPDDAHVASGSDDSTICVWATRTGELVTGPLKGDQGSVLSISYSHNGAFIASGGYDGTVVLWDVGGTPRQVWVYKAHTYRVGCVSFSDDDRRIVSGSGDCTVLVLDVESGQVVAGPFQGHTSSVTSVTFSPDCKRIASGSWDSTVRIWDVGGDTNSETLFDGHKGGIRCIALSSDSRRIVSGSEDSTIRIWESGSGESIGLPLERVVSGSRDKTTRVRDVARGETMTVPRSDQQDDHSATYPIPSASLRTENKTRRKQRTHTTAQLKPGTQGTGLDTRNPPPPTDREPIIVILQCCAHEDSQWITAMAFSHDGSRIASGSRDTTIRIFSAKDLTKIFEPFRGHTAAITSLSFSSVESDEDLLASGSVDCSIRIWDMSQGQIRATLPCEHVNSPVVFLHFFGNNLVTCSEDAEVQIRDMESGLNHVHSHKKRIAPGTSLAFAFLGKLLVESRNHRLAQSYLTMDPSPLQCLRWSETKFFPEAECHEDYVTSVAISPDGKTVASGSKDCSVRLWKQRLGTFEHKWTVKHNSWVMCITFSSDSRYVISGSLDGTIRVWDVEFGRGVGDPFQADSQVLCILTYVDLIAWGTTKGTLQTRNLRSLCAQVSHIPDASHTAGDDTRRTPEDEPAGSDNGSDNGTDNGSRSEDSGDAASVDDGPDDLETRESGKLVGLPLKGHEGGVFSVAYSPDNQRVVSGSNDKTVRVWDVTSGETVMVLRGHSKMVFSVAYSNNGRFIASASSDGTNRIWNAEIGHCIHSLQVGVRGYRLSIAFSPDSKFIVSNSPIGFRIWDVETGNMTIESKVSSLVYSVTFSHDGKLVATGSENGGIHVWNATTGQLVLGPFKDHTDRVFSVAFSHDDNFIVSGSDDSTVRLWDTKTGQPLMAPFKGHTLPVHSVVFSDDGKFVVSASVDGTIRIWSTEQVQHSLYTNQSTVDNDGWVKGENGELLFWVPPHNRFCLHRPNNTRIIGPNETQIDFRNARLGQDWTQCYTP